MSLLTILIPTLPRRWKFYNELRCQLAMQIGPDKPVMIISNHDTDISIGVKRNRLMQEVETPYVVFIDDDDEASKSYIDLVLAGIATKPDCCSLNGIYTLDGKNPIKFQHSIKHTEMKEQDGVLIRMPNHINCIKTELAKQCPFPDWKYSEDSNFAFQMQYKGLLKKEYWIEETLYYYLCRSDKSILG